LIETIVSKEIENLVDGLTRDQLLDLRIATLSKLDAAIATKLGEVGPLAGPSEQSKPQSKKLTLAQAPLALAIPQYLAACSEPQTAKQIATALMEAGREFESSRPVHTVRTALAKLIGTNDDVFHATWCKWWLKSKCTKGQLEKFTAKNAKFGTGGHSKKEHGKRTSVGIKRRREQGLHWGPTLKMTPELIERAKSMLRDGTSLTDVCKELNVSTWTLYQVGIRQRALKKEGEQSKERKEGETDPSADVIPLHGRAG
jgi:hypothetical protein